MRTIIDQILNGDFEYESGLLEFSCTKLDIIISQGSNYEGSFRIQSQSGILTEGYVVTTDYRMECLTPEFSGTEDEVLFRFHGETLEAGESVKGLFHVISNQGEYKIPFEVSVQKQIPQSTIGEIKNLFHFANLAKMNWQEAVHVFYDPCFQSIFSEHDEKKIDIYRGLSAQPGNEQNVEEFLIHVNKKQRVEFLVDEQEIVLELSMLEQTGEVLEEEINIVRNGWGYTSLNIECDGDFVSVEQELLSDDQFLGNRCRLPVLIDTSRCRQGKNFARVVLYNSHTYLTIPVTVIVGDIRKARHFRSVMEAATVELMGLYEDFRLKKIDSQDWMKESQRLLEQLASMDETNVSTKLFQVQLLISQGNRNEAEWLLEHARMLYERASQIDDTILAYYYYLTTLIHPEEEYVHQVVEDVQSMYRMDLTNWRISWLLLYLSEEYNKSDLKRWKFLEEQYQWGGRSPILYLEALQVLESNPAFLRKMGPFEVQVIYYGVKHQAYSDELAEQILYVSGKVKVYSRLILCILAMMYESKQDVRILNEICVLLIKGGKVGSAYFSWYEKGVEAQCRITNLHEYYMMSLNLNQKIELPKILLRYFAYQNQLDSEHCAYLYAYLCRNKEKYMELYGAFRGIMERFVIDEIQKHHMSESHAELYREMVVPTMITKDIAEAFSKLLFCCKISVMDSRLRKVIVYQNGNKCPREYSIQNGVAWALVYGNMDTLLFEDAYGNRFVRSVEYTKEQMLNPSEYIQMVSPYVNDNLELNLYMLEAENYEVNKNNIQRVENTVRQENVEKKIRRQMVIGILHYYWDMDHMRTVDQFLEEISGDMLSASQRGEVVKIMVLRGKLKKALQWIRCYGPYFVEPKILIRLLDENIQQNHFVKEEVLTVSAQHVFRKGKYDGVLLSYLIHYFEGSTREMRNLFNVARSFELDCYKLAERMIVQMLFSGVYVAEKMDVFRYYVSQGGKQEVQRAFLEQCAYDYFVKQKMMDSCIFKEIRNAYYRKEEIHFIAKLAFLKYYGENPDEIVEEDNVLLQAYMSEMMERGIHLNCFRSIKSVAHLLRDMKDKTIIEYHAKPGRTVEIHYVIMDESGESGEYLTETMKAVYGGVCFREFILFSGESLQYYITEAADGVEQVTESGKVGKNDNMASDYSARYEMINDLIISKTLQDYDTLDNLLKDYYYKEYWNQELLCLM